MKKAIILGLLLSSTLLVGCSNSKKTTEVSKESKIEKSSSKKEETQKASTTSEETASTDQTVPESSSQSIPQSQSASEPSTAQRDFDTDAIAKGDYSSAAGVWKNGIGDSYVINNDGTGTAISSNGAKQDFTIKPTDKGPFMTVPLTEEQKKLARSGAHVNFIKIGENHWTIENAESDKTKPRMTIDQGELSSSDQIFYREN